MRVVVYAFLLMLLVACKGGGGGDSVTSGAGSFNGVYQLCENNTDDNISMRSTVFVNSVMISEVTRYYGGLNCGAGNELFEDRSIYNYAKNGSGYRLAYVAMTSTSLSASDLNYSNSNSYCGYNDWTLNIPKLILGRSCDGDTINYGDYMDLNVRKSGSNLVISGSSGTAFTYPSIGPWNFANQGQTVANGTWVYFDGETGAILSTNNGSYTMTYFDPNTLRYFTATGTYTSANNVVQTTTVSYSPDCGDDEGTTYSEKFVQTNFSLAIQGPTANEGTVFEKTPLTSAEIQGAIFTGYSAGCF